MKQPDNPQEGGVEDQEKGIMNILRETLVSRHEAAIPNPPFVIGGDIQLCDQSGFGARLQQALIRADRMEQSFALVLLRIRAIPAFPGSAALILQRIRAILRKSDSLLQYGPEHFALLLDGILDPDAVSFAVEKVIHGLEMDLPHGMGRGQLEVRAGVSVFPEDGYLSEALWAAAEHALAGAGSRGKNRVRFAGARRDHHARERQEFCTSLYHGLRNREFEIHYQPMVDTRSGDVHSVELLLRWKHPQRGLQPTERFLWLLEETGVIIPVGDWLLDTAFHQARQLRKAGHGSIRFSINLSERQLLDAGFIEKLEWMLHDKGLEPDMLEFECRETVLVRNQELMRESLYRLKALGIPVCLDRFTGNNHVLSELMRLPLSGLKIDRKLIRRLPFDRASKAITGGILAFTDCMDIRAGACGVENMGQLKFLRERSCQQIQGNFIARPMAFDELEQWLPN
jgi:EAL domain-containing protein (putative c-di-GMP-specific phosphodiesterase class I)/GGDEF domain-containing protein